MDYTVLSSHDRRRVRENLKYRWEFTRRDPEYKRLYFEMLEDVEEHDRLREEFDSQFEEALRSGSREQIESKRALFLTQSEQIGAKIEKLALEFQQRFGFPCYRPLTPDKKFQEIEPIINELLGWTVKRPVQWTIKFMDSFTSLKHLLDGDTLKIEVDLRLVNSKTILRRELGRIIDKSLQRRPVYKKKDLGLILKIGDLHFMEGLKVDQIVDMIFPADSTEQPGDARREIYNRLDQYRELVNGGYRQITYP